MGELRKKILLKKGAEASLHLSSLNGRKVVFKTRFPKKYRNERLDREIRTYRTIHEPQLLNEARKVGVATPLVFQVDMKNAAITMEFIEGKQVKQLLGSLSAEKREAMCSRIGQLIGRLHKSGLIHGDLTTSNMIVNPKQKIVLVDFGLGEKNTELEARGVDLHLMKRTLQSTHYRFAEECFEAITKGYAATFGETEAKDVFRKIKEIEKRGRYVEKGNEN